MKGSRSIAVSAVALLVSIGAYANDRVTVFNGFGISIDKITDVMTDTKSCALFVQDGPVYLAIDDGSKVVIWPNMEGLSFSFDSEHLIRINNGKPVALRYLSKRNALEIPTASASKMLIDALLKGEPVQIRYFDWPGHEPRDIEVQSPKFSYAWGIAVKECNWRALGAPTTLPAAKLDVSRPLGNDGSAIVRVADTNDFEGLGLSRGSDRYGGSCQITISSMGILGRYKGQWKTEELLSMGLGKVVVYDQQGNVVFSAKLPGLNAHAGSGGGDWPPADGAAKAMWNNAPYGTISVTGPATVNKERVPLYGFRALWQWGMENCSFPTLNGSTVAIGYK